MGDELDEALKSALRDLPPVDPCSSFQRNVMASIECHKLAAWDLSALGRPMALGASLGFLTLALAFCGYQLWLEMENAGTLMFANLILMDAEVRQAHLPNLLAAFWDSLPVVTLVVLLAMLALYAVPLRLLSSWSRGSRLTFNEAGRH